MELPNEKGDVSIGNKNNEINIENEEVLDIPVNLEDITHDFILLVCHINDVIKMAFQILSF